MLARPINNCNPSAKPSLQDRVRDATLGFLRGGKQLTALSTQDQTNIRAALLQSFPPAQIINVANGTTDAKIDALVAGGNLYVRFNDAAWKSAGKFVG